MILRHWCWEGVCFGQIFHDAYKIFLKNNAAAAAEFRKLRTKFWKFCMLQENSWKLCQPRANDMLTGFSMNHRNLWKFVSKQASHWRIPFPCKVNRVKSRIVWDLISETCFRACPSWDEMHFFQDSCTILTKTWKIMHYSWRISQDLTKNYQSWKILADKAFLERFLQDSFKNYVFCRILGKLISSARLLQEKIFGKNLWRFKFFAWIWKNLARYAFQFI